MADNNKNGNNTIFRQKSLDRVTSVEDLDKYIKTTTPSLWLLLASIIIFLLGIIVWAVVGKINVESVSGCSINKGTVSCLIAEDRVEKIDEDSYIEINGKVISIDEIKGPFKASEDSNQSLLHNSLIEYDSWYYEVCGTTDLNDGVHKGKVVFEKISPIIYVVN